MASASDFYVYAYFRPDGSPCYIGKGRGRRWRSHIKWSANSILNNILKKYGEIPCLKIRQGLSEKEAFETEIALIKAIGRGSKGPLVNLTDGGEGSTGYIAPPHVRAKLSVRSRSPERLAALAKMNTSPENIERLVAFNKSPEHREAARRLWSTPEYLEWIAERNRSAEQRALVAATGRRPATLARLLANATKPEWRKRRGEMSRDPAHREKLIEHNQSPEHRAQVAERNRCAKMREASSLRAKQRNSSPEFQVKAREGLIRYFAERKSKPNIAGASPDAGLT